ncbi:MAG: hypothetical protein R8P61_35870 [Bacteroidia bacterium]|nr:hypothetical protein [Bacteroidia bacterium]
MSTITHKDFLSTELSSLLQKLSKDSKPSFGIMTAQHMVEHLTWIIKSSVKNYGEAPEEPSKGQLKFKQFIANGAVFKHFPKDDAEVGKLKYASLEEALEQIPFAIQRFYDFFEANPDHIPFNPIMGSLSFAELELFHYQHCRYHLWQFGLIEEYG